MEQISTSLSLLEKTREELSRQLRTQKHSQGVSLRKGDLEYVLPANMAEVLSEEDPDDTCASLQQDIVWAAIALKFKIEEDFRLITECPEGFTDISKHTLFEEDVRLSAQVLEELQSLVDEAIETADLGLAKTLSKVKNDLYHSTLVIRRFLDGARASGQDGTPSSESAPPAAEDAKSPHAESIEVPADLYEADPVSETSDMRRVVLVLPPVSKRLLRLVAVLLAATVLSFAAARMYRLPLESGRTSGRAVHSVSPIDKAYFASYRIEGRRFLAQVQPSWHALDPEEKARRIKALRKYLQEKKNVDAAEITDTEGRPVASFDRDRLAVYELEDR